MTLGEKFDASGEIYKSLKKARKDKTLIKDFSYAIYDPKAVKAHKLPNKTIKSFNFMTVKNIFQDIAKKEAQYNIAQRVKESLMKVGKWK
jgi:hypothetical protein